MSQYPSYPPQPPYQVPYGASQWQSGGGYPQGGGGVRPGLVTAIGVISIVVASLSFLGSGFSILEGFVTFRVSQFAATMSTSSSSSYNTGVQGAAANRVVFATSAVPAQSPETAPAVDAPEINPHGLGKTDRETIALAIETLEALSPGNERALDKILARVGREVFPVAGQAGPAPPMAMTTAAVLAAVKEHGSIPSPNPNVPEPLYFDTAGGHLELRDDRAIFRPADRSEPAVRISAPEPQMAPEPLVLPPPPGPSQASAPATPATVPAADDPFAPPPVATDPFAPPVAPAAGSSPSAGPSSSAGAATPPSVPSGSGLSLTQARGVVAKAQAACGNKLNPAQVNTLQTALMAPNQVLVTPGTLWSPVSVAIVQPADGMATLKMNGSLLQIDSLGNIVNQYAGGMPKISLNPMPVALVVGESVASLALAAFLMAAGILLLKQSPRAPQLLQIYALIKIPLAVIAIAGFSWMMSDIFDNMVRPAGGTGQGEGMRLFGKVMLGGGLIFPVALLLALRARVVRDYYR